MKFSVAYRVAILVCLHSQMFVPTGLAVYYLYPDGFSYWEVLGTLAFFAGMSI